MTLYRLADDVEYRVFADGTAVYVPATRETLLLDVRVGALLERLRHAGAQALPDLVDVLSRPELLATAPGNDEDYSAWVDVLVSHAIIDAFAA